MIVRVVQILCNNLVNKNFDWISVLFKDVLCIFALPTKIVSAKAESTVADIWVVLQQWCHISEQISLVELIIKWLTHRLFLSKWIDVVEKLVNDSNTHFFFFFFFLLNKSLDNNINMSSKHAICNIRGSSRSSRYFFHTVYSEFGQIF